MLLARSRRKASRCNVMLLFSMTMACFCLQEGRSEGSRYHLSIFQMVISNHFIDIWPINTIGNVHDASQCADSAVLWDMPSNCCGLHIDDRLCRNGYKASSVSFEECQKTDEGCSFFNSCFSCVLSPPGKDAPRPPPRNHKIQPRTKDHPALNFTQLVRTEYMHSSGLVFALIASWHCRWSRSNRTTDLRRRSFFTWSLLRRSVPTDLLRQHG